VKFAFKRPATARRSLAAIAVLGLLGCGTAWGQAKKPDQREPPTSTLGAYLSGAYGETKSDFGFASQALARALQADPDNPELQARLMASSIADGRLDLALSVAKKIVEHTPNDELANLALGTDAARRKDFKAAKAAFGQIGRDGPNALIMPLVMAWVEMGLGDANKAIDALKPLAALAGVGNFQDMHAGFINELAGKRAEAEKHFRAAYDRTSPPSLRIADALATFYWKQNRKDDARKIYREFLVIYPQSLNVEIALQRLEQGKAPDPVVASPAGGLGEALFNIAGAMQQENLTKRSLIYARLALHLRSDSAATRFLIASQLEGLERPEEAILMYRSIPNDSSYSWTARLAAVTDLVALKRLPEAVKILEEMSNERKDRSDSLILLGNVHRSEKAFDKAVAAYDRAFARIPKIEKRHWNLFYSRGIALERTKQWDRAEADFKRSLELNPDEPHVLNYLAYSWVERGVNLVEAEKMLEKAVSLRRTDGYIVDSLGWVLYTTGRYAESVKHLERAVELRPVDPTINDHLGDAYWRVGRFDEARFQWSRALSLDPEPEDLPKIKDKLEKGLPADTGKQPPK